MVNRFDLIFQKDKDIEDPPAKTTEDHIAVGCVWGDGDGTFVITEIANPARIKFTWETGKHSQNESYKYDTAGRAYFNNSNMKWLGKRL